MSQSQPVYTVTQINTYIKSLLDGDHKLSGVYIRGEISNYKKYPSGHHYFSLKDQTGALRCVMFRSAATRLRFRPEGGMKVIAYGRITAFPRDGQYQFYVNALTPDGVGELYVAFEQLKEKLFQEGLFATEHKKPLPRYPGSIAVITSSAGAAVHDVIRVLGARWPMAAIKLLPVRVQGQGAAQELTGAVRYVNRWKLADLIVIGRGGGSMEDLWAFNNEQLVRAVYDSQLPVISAVGHEPDVTMIDFVADVRAATPSNGAELAVPDQQELRQQLDQIGLRMYRGMTAQLGGCRQRLNQFEQSTVLTEPMYPIQERRAWLDQQQSRLIHGLQQRVNEKRTQFAGLVSALDALSPLNVLSRGYVFAKDETGAVVTSAASVELGERLSLRLLDGELGCTVMEQHLFEKQSTEENRRKNGCEKENL